MAEQKSVNEKLRQARLQRGWSQQYIADKLKIAVGTVNRWERGKQQPTAYYRLKLCTLFGTGPEALGLEKQAPDAHTENNASVLNATGNGSNPGEEQQTLKENLVTLPPTNSPIVTENQLNNVPRKKNLSKPMLLLSSLALILLIVLSTAIYGRRFIHQRQSVSTHVSGHQTQAQFLSPTPSNHEQLVFDDPLTSNIHQWSTGAECSFAHSAYRISSNGVNYCLMGEQTFSNMKYQIDMSLLTGTWAGITFRANDNSDLYYFSLNAKGQYEVDMVGNTHKQLLLGNNPAILTGYNKWNVLSVEANKTHLLFWVNGHNVGQIQDTTYTEGYVGVCVGYYNNASDPIITTALFHNALIWQFS